MAPVSDDESQASLGLRWDEEEAAASSPQERFVTMPDWGWHGLYFPVQGQRGTIPPEGMKGSFKQGQSASFMAQSG
ncbi:unnamed protein product [Arctogadus glacialis]